MFPRLQTTWTHIRTSLWALPLAMVFVGSALAVTAVNIRLAPKGDPVWFLYSGSAGDAPEFLSAMMSSMITMGTLVISITMVVLTLAAQQLGPRLIQSFTSDWRTQASIGLFVGTIAYLLLVLRTLYGGLDGVPNLAVTIGTALVLISVVVLVLFVHHLARSIIADTVIERVGEALDGAAARLLPDQRPEGDPPLPPPSLKAGAEITLPRGGYVQAVDHDRLVTAAGEQDAVVELTIRAGHHGLPGGVYGWISPPSALTSKFQEAFEESILVGSGRTPVQDLEFSIRQLVEVAIRALSPGINDPFTAIVAIDRLALSIARMMQRSAAPTAWKDKSGVIRVFGPASSFEGVMAAAFNQIRQSAETQPSVLIRLAETLGQLAAQASNDQPEVIARHLFQVGAAGSRAIPDPCDLRALEDRIQDALAHIPAVIVTQARRTAGAADDL